jgi:coenzyme F420-reducing hydrogenase gamma subunit
MTPAATNGRPTVGLFGLTGCAGDQLVVLNCEDQLLELARLLDLRDFTMAASDPDEEAPLDLAFVEGAVLSRRDEYVLRRVRERAKCLIAIGTCAVWGGVAALDRLFDRAALVRDIYGDAGAAFDTLPARALHDVVPVDYTITGCPIEADEFLAAVSQLLQGLPPTVRDTPVCAECRMNELGCLLLDRGLPCCGAVTLGGCHARCPALGALCIGCRGPAPDANVEGTLAAFVAHGIPIEEGRRRLAVFAPLPEAVPAEVA